MISSDLADFGQLDLHQRLQRSGLPPFFLADVLPERDFQEWVDSYWAKDVLELFWLERRHSFMRFCELLMAHSGAMFESTRFARPCEVSRTTISKYLAVLEATLVAHVIRPFAHRPRAEIRYWRSKHGNEIDFVIIRRGSPPVAVECKWSAVEFPAHNMRAFRRHYPEDDNFVVAANIDRLFERRVAGMRVRVVGLEALVQALCDVDPNLPGAILDPHPEG